LLIPRGSYLLESSEPANFILPFDDAALVYPWRHTDPRVDQLAKTVSKIVQSGEKLHLSRAQIFQNVRGAAREAAGLPPLVVAASTATMRRAAVPYMNEPWYCCAEPAEDQFVPLARLAESRPSAEGFV
jgi:hypothetical protein